MHTERNMSDTYTNEDLFDALALLHSTDENSAEKLRRMLDACIEKKYGRDKTLAARMPRRFLQNTDDVIASMRISKKRDHVPGRCVKTIKGEIWDGSKVGSLLESNMTENITNHQTADIKVYEVNYEDCCDDQNVPRISIPDEGSADGTVCKICNGAKLGPLILLECQECQEAYHPLCHQPPVIDVDVYDPRFVWRCRRCVETSSATSTKVRILEKRSVEKKIRRNTDTIKGNANISGLKIPIRRRDDLY
ncbi:integrator complex subunit 12-like [Cataglyphis hispanica]|uniref:integrator complex subunit 12-like n=1 Tax=Cataglyphis hispanica TaxID=1086592 RepID=UPI0021808B15|nr:integrator complex subunit 12-like [Cataglyphis hispanica]